MFRRPSTLLASSLSRFLSASSASASVETVANLPVFLSDRAADRIRALSKQSKSTDLKLRLAVDGGGCSGFSYKFSVFTGPPEPEDELFGQKDAILVIDRDSLEYVKGSKVDFTEDLIRRSFEVVDNPQVETKCGCGTSFSIKEPKV